MGRRLTRTASVEAGQQLLGTEFSVSAHRVCDDLLVKEVHLAFTDNDGAPSTEAKSWFIDKVDGNGNRFIVYQSLTTAGVPGTTIAANMSAFGKEVELILERGSQIQIRTVGATSRIRAEIIVEEQPCQ